MLNPREDPFEEDEDYPDDEDDEELL